ncbi:MAG: hypothetical protein K2G03_00845, partial [Bacilli bacterium]|nr:hypothetical protein [Bacilli bacterium]
MKRLINMGNKRFILRKDRNYIQKLLDFDITEKEAWYYILSLNANYYVVDYKPNYASSNDSLFFKRRFKQGW